MPIEIKELHIKINVNDGKGAASSEGGGESAAGGDMVGECVEQVLETIKKQKER